MADDMRPQGVQAPRDEPGHEPDALSFRGIVLFAIGLTLFTGLVMAGIGGMMGYFAGEETREEKQAEAVQPELFKDPAGQFPGPALQADDTRDMANYRAGEARQLTTYGWDPKAGVAHIPIGRAMDLLVKSGLPTARAATPEPKSGPTSAPEGK